MNNILSVFIMIISFVTLIVIHELGHYWTAKQVGVKVKEFGIGIPPRIKKLRTTKTGTLISLNAIPLGGFVRLKGDNLNDYQSFIDQDSFITQKRYHKVYILIGGIVMNVLCAWLLLTFVFAKGITPLNILPDTSNSRSFLLPSISFAQEKELVSLSQEAGIIIYDVLPESIAQQLGIQTNDTITMINQELVNTENISEILTANSDQEISITWNTPQGETYTKSQTCPTPCLLGIQMQSSSLITLQTYHTPRYQAPGLAAHEIYQQSKITLTMFYDMIANIINKKEGATQQALTNLSGPVGIVKIGQDILGQQQRVAYLVFMALISLALAIFNILPIPGVDGGRILGVLIQTITRISPQKYYKTEALINFFIIVLLMAGGVFIIAKDSAQFYCADIPGMSQRIDQSTCSE